LEDGEGGLHGKEWSLISSNDKWWIR